MSGMEQQTINIIRLEPNQKDQAGILFARIFYDYPYFKTIFPDEHQRQRLLPWYLGTLVRYCQIYGEVDATIDLDGMACWLPPGQTNMTTLKYVRAGYGSFFFRLGWTTAQKAMVLDEFLIRAQKKYAPMPHWYLLLLGVVPEHQGQGIGTQMLKPRLALADSKGLPCYLETHLLRDVSFYQKFGFTVVFQSKIPGSDEPCWIMLREPQPHSS
jgi:GNAT superfamily N-acetyltransferase